MSVAVCRSSVASGFESILALPAAFSASSGWLHSSPAAPEDPQAQTEAEGSPGEADTWASTQARQKAQQEPLEKEEPYVHPLMRRSSSLLSQKSLEVCTENLGSESGSDDYFPFSDDDESNLFAGNKQTAAAAAAGGGGGEELAHKEKRMRRSDCRCCSMSRASEPRRFPPPLPSISRRDGPCLKMRPLRRDGRLVVEAVTVPSQNYLQAQRRNGRLLLSFINAAAATSHNSSFGGAVEGSNATGGVIHEEEAQDGTEEEEEEEEEVQVVDRGTVVEVNVSTKPPQQNKRNVRRSSIVINKFVSFTPAINNEDTHAAPPPAAAAGAGRPPVRRSSTTAAAAAVAASSLSASTAGDVAASSPATAENKLMLTCRRRRNREELLLDMRRCGQLRRPLFFRETCCIATSSS